MGGVDLVHLFMKEQNDYRELLYSRYVSSHTGGLYGEVTLERVKAQFSIWRIYFGRFLPKDKSAFILDLGCGDGSFVYWLREEGYVNVFGIDASKEQVARVGKLGIQGVTQGDARVFLQGALEKYDCIFARDFIEHFTKDEIMEIFALVLRALKPGGVFVMQVPNAENPLWGRLCYGDFTHETVFTQQSARQALLASGFSGVCVYPQRPVVHGLLSFVRYVIWRVVELVLHAYLVIETGSSRAIFTQNIIVKGERRL